MATDSPTDQSSCSWVDWLALVWLSVTSFLAVRWLASVLRCRRLVRRSTGAPDHLRRLMWDVASDMRCNTYVDLRCCAEPCSPFLFGIRRPCIVLPDHMTGAEYRDELTGVLAHELAHVRSGDMFWMRFLDWITLLLWFHPLTWGVRTAHAVACEHVGDGDAAGYIGDSDKYTRTLARVALELRKRRQLIGAIPMARTAEVIRRLAALKQDLPATPLTRGQTAWGSFAALSLLIGLGACTVLAGPPDDPTAMRMQQVWRSPDLASDFSTNGRFVSFIDWRQGNLALHDLVTKKTKNLSQNAVGKRPRRRNCYSFASQLFNGINAALQSRPDHHDHSWIAINNAQNGHWLSRQARFYRMVRPDYCKVQIACDQSGADERPALHINQFWPQASLFKVSILDGDLRGKKVHNCTGNCANLDFN